MKNETSIRKQNFYKHIIAGILFLVSGILSNFSIKGIELTGSIIALISCCIILFMYRSNREQEDEMTKLYMGEAYRFGFYCTLISMISLEIINLISESCLKKSIIGFGSFGSIIMGIGTLSVGLYFAKLDGGIFDAKTED